jgi:tetratricopeptide (TPR) repeat protein
MPFRLIVVAAVAVLLAGCAAGRSELTPQREVEAGVGAARSGYWQEALFRFENAREKGLTNAPLLNNMAVAQEALGRYEEALATYRAALELAPRDAVIRRNYARFAEFYTSYARGVMPKEGPDASR